MSDQYSHGGDTTCFLLMDKPDWHMRADKWPPQQDFSNPRWYPMPCTTAVKEPNPEPPLSMVEAWERHNGYNAEQAKQQHVKAMARLRAIEDGAVLSRQFSESDVKAIIERMRKCQRRH